MRLVPTIRLAWFDAKPIERAIENASEEILRASGARWIRAVSAGLKYKPGSSRPGEPPHLHRTKTGRASPLTKLAFELPTPMSLRVGIDGKIPAVLEHGGTSTRKDGRRITIKPRPFMRPAWDAELMRLPAEFEHAVTGV